MWWLAELLSALVVGRFLCTGLWNSAVEQCFCAGWCNCTIYLLVKHHYALVCGTLLCTGWCNGAIYLLVKHHYALVCGTLLCTGWWNCAIYLLVEYHWFVEQCYVPVGGTALYTCWVEQHCTGWWNSALHWLVEQRFALVGGTTLCTG